MPTTPTFDWPFYFGGGGISVGASESGGVTRRIPKTVTLDGYVFDVDVAKWKSGPVDTFRDAVVANDQPNDTLFNAKGAWARYKYSWHHGQGQSLGDLDETADPFRFRKADRVEWSTKYQLTLHHTATNIRSVASAAPVICRSGIYVFLSDGATLYRTSDGVTWTAMTAPGGTVNAMSSDGTDLYVATTTKCTRYLGSGTADTPFGTPIATATDNVAFMSGRLLIGQANVLKEVSAAGALTTVKTHFQAAFRWTTMFNIGSRMYVGGYAGQRSELHTLTTDSTGNLVQSQEATPLPMGELLNFGLAYSGECVLCSSKGVRFAEVSGDGTLTYGPLVDEVGDVRHAAADGRFVYAGWSSIDGTRSGVAKFAVDDEVAPLQPAYGVDVSTGTTGTVAGVARLNGLTIFALASTGGFVQQSAYEGQGTLHSGNLTFGTVEPKALTTLTAGFFPLLTGESVKMEVFDENGVLIAGNTESTVDATEVAVDLNGEMVTAFEVRVTLLGPGTSTPKLYRWRVRSYPIPPPVLQWFLPLIVKEGVTIGNGQGVKQSMDLETMHLWIEDLYASKRFTVLRTGEQAYKVRVDSFQWEPESWDAAGNRPQGTLIVQVVSAA